MKLWIDDIRPAPDNSYTVVHSVNEAKAYIEMYIEEIELINIDHDAGEYRQQGGDYIRILDWLEEQLNGNKLKVEHPIKIKIKIHSMNPVGAANMRAIIERNGWIYDK